MNLPEFDKPMDKFMKEDIIQACIIASINTLKTLKPIILKFQKSHPNINKEMLQAASRNSRMDVVTFLLQDEKKHSNIGVIGVSEIFYEVAMENNLDMIACFITSGINFVMLENETRKMLINIFGLWNQRFLELLGSGFTNIIHRLLKQMKIEYQLACECMKNYKYIKGSVMRYYDRERMLQCNHKKMMRCHYKKN